MIDLGKKLLAAIKAAAEVTSTVGYVDDASYSDQGGSNDWDNSN